MDADEKVKEVLIEAGREGITAINLAKKLGLKEDRKSAYNLVYRAKQKHPSWEIDLKSIRKKISRRCVSVLKMTLANRMFEVEE